MFLRDLERSVNINKVAGRKPVVSNFTIKVTLLHWCFSCFLSCINGTKSRNASHIDILGRNIKDTPTKSKDLPINYEMT